MKKSIIIDIINFPIKGNILIESSAGTGKTYIIAALYLRLILGINIYKYKYTKPLCVKEILVVTFTEIATKELRDRIKKNICNMYLACINKKSKDLLLSYFLSHIKDLNLAKILLLTAEKQMDECSILTIHSFCKRILNQDIVYSGILYKKKFLENEYLLQKKSVEDFWIKYLSNLPMDVSYLIYSKWNCPEKLLKEIYPNLLNNSFKNIKNNFKKKSICTLCKNFLKKIKYFKNTWKIYNKYILNSLLECKINKRIYNKKNILLWIKKINKWSIKKNKKFYLPKELLRFNLKKLKIQNKSKNIFFAKLIKLINNLYKHDIYINNFIYTQAIYKVHKIIFKEKNKNLIIGFDDLLDIFINLLNKNLIKSIIKKYPIAMIDEFQDTDPRQYKIFKKIYFNKKNNLLLIIGDPKQTIYTFRGANIYNYLEVRNKIKKIYTLEKNWRSSSLMVQATNYLFSLNKNPFIFKDIIFNISKFSKKNLNMNFLIKDILQPSINFLLSNNSNISNYEYKNFISDYCAYKIKLWLKYSNFNQAFFKKNNKKILLKSSDITILVRDKYEANLIKKSLLKLKISSVYLSDNTSVFNTYEAQELMLILKASLHPEKNNNITSACSTSIIGLSFSKIEFINNNYYELEKITQKFIFYRNIWKNYGISSMIKYIITKSKKINIFYEYEKNLQILTNLFHLSEILEKKFYEIKSKNLLINWFKKKIESSLFPEEHEKIHVSNNKNLIKIMTIYKSKGLEFPIVFFPFSFSVKSKKHCVIYNKRKYIKNLDLKYKSSDINLETTMLSEDIRLLYVAITRSIYHCSIGISPIQYKKNVKNNFKISAIEYIFKKNKKNYSENIYEKLLYISKQTKNNISFKNIKYFTKNYLLENKFNKKFFYSNKWKNRNLNLYNIISFSNLKKNNFYKKNIKNKIILNLDKTFKKVNKNNIKKSFHTFPIGKKSGTLLHNILQQISFKDNIKKKFLIKQLKENNFNLNWKNLIFKWIANIINFPIFKNFSLSCLENKNYITELNFYLYIKNNIEIQDIDFICKNYDKLSKKSSLLNSLKTQGIFKGFIDLIFLWKKKYYIIDYKSNKLGNNDESYNIKNIKKSIIDNRYDIQYNVYTLALHKYLSKKLLNYTYRKNFGGIIYIFLRGINFNYPIYFNKPKFDLIKKLNSLIIE